MNSGEKPNVEDHSGLLQDKYKLSLNSLDLFDKVINLKLTTADGEVFVIRSDYETYFPNTMKSVMNNDYSSFIGSKVCYIRKCQYKPSIKIQYKQVSMSTPVNIDIFINNFFMLDKNGKVLKNFNNLTNAIKRVDVALGYFGQFKSYMQKNNTNSITTEALFNFNQEDLKGHGITVISMMDVQYVQTDKLPPDMTIHIHGYVGNLYTGDITSKIESEDYETRLSEKSIVDYSEISGFSVNDTLIEKLLFNCITKNFVGTKANLPLSVKAKFEDENSYVLKEELTDSEARLYGIRVYLSSKAKKIAKEFDENHTYKDSTSADYNSFLAKVKKGNNAIGTTRSIVEGVLGLRGNLSVACPASGNLLLYSPDELKSISEMIDDTDYEKDELDGSTFDVYWKNKLPAVYNITTDALCTVVCPFFFFLKPFQKFYFKSAYALSGLVSYYAKFTASEDEFYALWQTVSFATVEDINECTIVCTGKES